MPDSFLVFLYDVKNKNFDCFVAVTTKKVSDGEYFAILGDFN